MWATPEVWLLSISNYLEIRVCTTELNTQQIIRVTIGSVNWFSWLQDEFNYHFNVYLVEDGTVICYSVQCESKATGDKDWYAFNRINGNSNKLHLGKSAEITVERLIAIGKKFQDIAGE